MTQIRSGIVMLRGRSPATMENASAPRARLEGGP